MPPHPRFCGYSRRKQPCSFVQSPGAPFIYRSCRSVYTPLLQLRRTAIKLQDSIVMCGMPLACLEVCFAASFSCQKRLCKRRCPESTLGRRKAAQTLRPMYPTNLMQRPFDLGAS